MNLSYNTRLKIFEKLLSQYRIRDSEINIRCPFCGDSKKSQDKMRGWYNFDKDVYHCFNTNECDVPYPAFAKLIKQINPKIDIINLLARNMKKEELGVVMQPTQVEQKPIVEQNYDDFISKSCMPIEQAKSSEAYTYYIKRKLDVTGYPFYLCVDNNERYYGRLIIPFFNEKGNCVYFQARECSEHSGAYKYLNPGSAHSTVFGIDRVDVTKPIVVLEGPIDSLFVENAVACCTSTLSKNQRKLLEPYDLVFMFDNDKAGWQSMLKMARAGKKVCFSMPWIEGYKDVNEAVDHKLDYETYIKPYVKSGLDAEVKLVLKLKML